MRRRYLIMLAAFVTVLALGFISNDVHIIGHDVEEGPVIVPSAGTAANVAVSAGGAVGGTVTYLGAPPAPKKLAVTKDVAVCGQAEHLDESLLVGAKKGIRYVIVSMVDVKGGKSLQSLGTEFVLDQKGCSYQPHVSLLPVNTPLQILNNDGILHNIHTFSTKNTPANIAQPKFKKKMEKSFTASENISVKCDVHAWMSAWIKVVDHPYHAVTDANGKYTITDVPPGTYTVEFWQETLGTGTAQVTVTAGVTTTLDLQYPAKK